MKAIWKGTVLAESDETIELENSVYFPRNTVKEECLNLSQLHTTCVRKGLCTYYDVVIDNNKSKDAAYSYLEPKPVAEKIRGYIGFWRDVEIVS